MENKNKKNIPDTFDLTQLDKNTFGLETHDEFFTIQEISYIADVDIKSLVEVIPKLNLKIDSLYSKKDIFKIIDSLSEKKVPVNKNKVEKDTENNQKTNEAIQLRKSAKVEYFIDDDSFSHEEIAALAGKSKEDVREAIYKLKFNYSYSFNKKESLLIIDYLADPNKYENNKASFIERSKKVSKGEWVLIIGGTALIAGGLVWYFTRNKRAANIAAGMATNYTNSWRYSSSNPSRSYSGYKYVRPYSPGGSGTVYTGPRGGRYTIGSTGRKKYF